MIICELEDRCGRTPWVGEFSAENGTYFSRNEDMPITFSKFIAAARNAYLPPQRQRYALVSDKLLLSPLGIEVSDVWSLIISYAGCPSCVMKYKEETSLQDALEMRDQPVIELLEDENGLGPSLPIDKPSIVLCVDRRSDSIETAKKSQEVLAQQHWKLHTDGRSRERPRKSLHTDKGSAGTYRNSRLVLSSASDKIKDKMSVVIIKDGNYVTLDDKASELQGSSLHEILTHLLGQDSKLSSLAKESGFQLLSDDIDIKITDVLSTQTGTRNLDSAGSLDEVAESTVINSPPGAEMEHLQHANVEPPFDDNEQKSSVDLASKRAGSVDSRQSFKDLEVVSSLLVDSEIQASVEADKSETLDLHYNRLTDHFLNGSVTPYQRSGPLRKAIEMSQPPFVNPDFQEKDPIPFVTTETFSELVIGNDQSDTHNITNAWHKDVVVLFSSSWCRFCQRMVLVVREVYWALIGYMNLVKCDARSKEQGAMF